MRISEETNSTGWIAYTPTYPWTLAEGPDGSRTVQVEFRDKVGNISTFTDSIILDATPPTIPGTPTSTSAYINTIDVTFTWAASTDTGGSGVEKYQVYVTENGVVKANWTEVSGTSYSLTGTNGSTYTCKVRAVDRAGNVGAESATSSTTVDTSPPTITLTAPPATNGLLSVSAEAADIGAGLKEVKFSANNLTNTCNIAPFAATWDTSAWPEGDYIVTAEAVDLAGNKATSSATVRVDRTAPTLRLSFRDADNNETTFTRSASVVIRVEVSDGTSGSGVDKVYLSNSGLDGSWVEVAGGEGTFTVDWQLPEPTVEGPNTVWAKAVDKAGNESIISAAITLDSIAPTVSLTAPPYTNQTTVQLAFEAADQGTGIAGFYLSNTGQPGDWIQMEISQNKLLSWELPAGDGRKTVYAKAADHAGNESVTSTTLILDTTPPEETGLMILDGAACTNTTAVTLNLAAADHGSGIAAMRFSNDGVTYTEWEDFLTVKAWDLAAGPDGARTVYVQFRDGAGNVTTASDGIVLDTKPPVVLTNIRLARPGRATVIFSRDTGLLTQSMPIFLVYDENPVTTKLSFKYTWDPATDFRPVGDGEEILLPDGARSFYFEVADEWGNTTASRIDGLLIDGTPPEIGGLTLALPVGTDGMYLAAGGEIPSRLTVRDPNGSGIGEIAYAFVEGETGAVGLEEGFVTVPASAGLEDYRLYLPTAGLANGRVYRVALFAADKLGNKSAIVHSAPFFLDRTPPALSAIELVGGVVEDGGRIYFTATGKLAVEFVAEDAESGIVKTEYALREGRETTPVTDWVEELTALSFTALQSGREYSLVVRVTNGVGAKTIMASAPMIFDGTGPEIVALLPDMTRQRNGHRLSGSLQVGEAESPLEKVLLAVGTAMDPTAVTAALPGANAQGWLEFPVQGLDAVMNYDLENLDLPNGIYHVTAKARNILGLEGAPVTVTVEIDDTLAPCPIVYDDGAFTTWPDGLHVRWEFPDALEAVDYYEYRVTKETAAGRTVIKDWTNAGQGTETLITGLVLENGGKYFIAVRALYASGTYSAVGESNGIVLETTPPEIVSVADGDWAGTKGIILDWVARDSESGLRSVEVMVTKPDGTPVCDWRPIPLTGSPFHLVTDARGEPLALSDGQAYFITVRATNWAGLKATRKTDGFTVDATPPPVPYIRDEGMYHNGQPHLSASWGWDSKGAAFTDPQSGIGKYEVVLTTYPELRGDETWTVVEGTSYTYTGPLQDKETYYFFVRATNGAGDFSIGRSDGITIDFTAPCTAVVDDGPASFYNNPHSQVAVSFWAEDPESGLAYYGYLHADPVTVETAAPEEYTASAEDRQRLYSVAAFPEGRAVVFRARAYNSAGDASSQYGYSDGFMVDLTPPADFAVTDEGAYTGEKRLRFSWTIPTSDAPLSQVMYALLAGNQNYRPPFGEQYEHDPANLIINKWVRLPNLRCTLELAGEELVEGTVYYLCVAYVDAAGNVGLQVSDGIVIDATPPTMNFAVDPIIANIGELVSVRFNLSEAAIIHFLLRGPGGGLVDERDELFQAGAGIYRFVPTNPGDYRLYAVPTDLAGNRAPVQAEKSIHVNAPPILMRQVSCTNYYGLQTTRGTRGQPLTFSVTAMDPEGTPLTYTWDFGDGYTAAGSDRTTHAYDGLGVYRVTVRITDAHGGSAESSLEIRIENTKKGMLFADEEWSGNMAVEGDVLVPAGLTLVVAPATTVAVNQGCELRVEGSLRVGEGARFDSTGGTWKGIVFAGTGSGELSGVTIGHALRGVACTGTGIVTLTGVTFRANQTGLHCYGGAITVESCRFESNLVYGIKEDNGCSPLVLNCVFVGNGINYYDEILTELTVDELNTAPNRGNEFC
ncbi:MAG: Ig-like domain-containing protein [Bacillota bacterium]